MDAEAVREERQGVAGSDEALQLRQRVERLAVRAAHHGHDAGQDLHCVHEDHVKAGPLRGGGDALHGMDVLEAVNEHKGRDLVRHADADDRQALVPRGEHAVRSA